MGLFDEHGKPHPQHFVYALLYAMAGRETAAKADDYENIRITASYDDRYNAVFLISYIERTKHFRVQNRFAECFYGELAMADGICFVASVYHA